MPPLIAIGVAATALGILAMVISFMLPVATRPRLAERLFNAGYGVFTAALTYWLLVSAAAFLTVSRFHGV